MPYSVLNPPISNEQVKLRFKEPYASRGLNRKMSVNTCHGIYRGFLLEASPTANRTVLVKRDPEFLDHSLVYQTLEDNTDSPPGKVPGYSLTIWSDEPEFAINLSDPSLVGQTVVLTVYAQYTVGGTTTAEFRVYTAAEWDDPDPEINPERAEVAVLGTINVPTLAQPIPASGVSYEKRSFAWTTKAKGANDWSPVIRNEGFEWSHTGQSYRHAVADWEIISQGGGTISASETGARTGKKCLEYTYSGGFGGWQVAQFIGAPVEAGRLFRVQVYVQQVLAPVGLWGSLAIYWGDKDGNDLLPSSVSLFAAGTDASYRLVESTQVIPVGACTLKRVELSAVNQLWSGTGAAVRFDGVQVYIERLSAYDSRQMDNARIRPQIVDGLIFVDSAAATPGSNAALFRYSASQNKLYLERKDGGAVGLPSFDVGEVTFTDIEAQNGTFSGQVAVIGQVTSGNNIVADGYVWGKASAGDGAHGLRLGIVEGSPNLALIHVRMEDTGTSIMNVHAYRYGLDIPFSRNREDGEDMVARLWGGNGAPNSNSTFTLYQGNHAGGAERIRLVASDAGGYIEPRGGTPLFLGSVAGDDIRVAGTLTVPVGAGEVTIGTPVTASAGMRIGQSMAQGDELLALNGASYAFHRYRVGGTNYGYMGFIGGANPDGLYLRNDRTSGFFFSTAATSGTLLEVKNGSAGVALTLDASGNVIMNDRLLALGASNVVHCLQLVDGSAQLRLKRTNSAIGYADLGADNTGFHIWPTGYSGGEKLRITLSGINVYGDVTLDGGIVAGGDVTASNIVLTGTTIERAGPANSLSIGTTVSTNAIYLGRSGVETNISGTFEVLEFAQFNGGVWLGSDVNDAIQCNGTLTLAPAVGGDFIVNRAQSTFAGEVQVDGLLDAKGNVDLGDSSTDTVSVVGRVDTNILANSNGLNLGELTGNRWNLYGNTISVANSVSAYTDGLNIGSSGGNRFNVYANVVDAETYFYSASCPAINSGTKLHQLHSSNMVKAWAKFLVGRGSGGYPDIYLWDGFHVNSVNTTGDSRFVTVVLSASFPLITCTDPNGTGDRCAYYIGVTVQGPQDSTNFNSTTTGTTVERIWQPMVCDVGPGTFTVGLVNPSTGAWIGLTGEFAPCYMFYVEVLGRDTND